MPFLALAHVAGAWLVTGNLKHFPEAVRNDVRVLSPGGYWLIWVKIRGRRPIKAYAGKASLKSISRAAKDPIVSSLRRLLNVPDLFVCLGILPNCTLQTVEMEVSWQP